MQIDAALLAYDAYLSKTGRMTIEEVIGSLTLPRPATIRDISYVLMLSFDPVECDRTHSVAVVTMDPDGVNVNKSETFYEPIVNPYDGYGYAHAVVPVTLVAREPGVYMLNVFIDGQHRHTTRVEVRIDPSPTDLPPAT